MIKGNGLYLTPHTLLSDVNGDGLYLKTSIFDVKRGHFLEPIVLSRTFIF